MIEHIMAATMISIFLNRAFPYICSLQRRKYYKHAMKARKEPGKYLSIIIDAMDQAKTFVPRFLNLGKSIGKMWRLKVHLIAVLIHGIGCFGFFDQFEYCHGSNLTISVLLHTLNTMRTSLPRTLYLQMDNCWRENKNR